MPGRIEFTDTVACIGHSNLFDSTADYDDQQVAKALCRRCRCLPECRQWLDGLPPSRKPDGIVAGIMVHPRVSWHGPTGNQPGRPHGAPDAHTAPGNGHPVKGPNMTNPDRDAIIGALREMTDKEARDTFNEARSTDVASRKARAAQAMADYIKGSRD
jgi:hypothetical protein